MTRDYEAGLAADVHAKFREAELDMRDVDSLGVATQVFLLGSKRDPRIAIRCIERSIDKLHLASDALNKALGLVISARS
jgi:hypothetical protein